MTEDKRIINNANSIIEEAESAFLATVNEHGFPQIRAMLNLRSSAQYPKQAGYIRKNAKWFETYFTTNTSSRKVAQIKRNGEGSVYYTRGFEGLLLTGMLEIVKDDAVKKALWESGWKLYYKGGLNDPDFTLLRFLPLSLEYYNDMKVELLDLRGIEERAWSL